MFCWEAGVRDIHRILDRKRRRNQARQPTPLSRTAAILPVSEDGPLEGDHHLDDLHLEQLGVARTEQDVQRGAATGRLRTAQQ